jgi:hypothetical protein
MARKSSPPTPPPSDAQTEDLETWTRRDAGGHQWRDRFVKRAWMATDQLLYHPMNYKVHPFAQQEIIQESLETLGWLQDIRVNVNTGHIFDGHERAKQADAAGQHQVPVAFYDLTEAEEEQALATLDPMVTRGGIDGEKLDELVGILMEDRAAEGRDGAADTPAMDAFLQSMVGQRPAPPKGIAVPDAPTGEYEVNEARQIVLHFSKPDFIWMKEFLDWARRQIGCDTNTETILALCKYYAEHER